MVCGVESGRSQASLVFVTPDPGVCSSRNSVGDWLNTFSWGELCNEILLAKGTLYGREDVLDELIERI